MTEKTEAVSDVTCTAPALRDVQDVKVVGFSDVPVNVRVALA